MKRVLFYFLPFILIACSLNKLGQDKSVTIKLTGNRNTIVIESDTITSNKYVLTKYKGVCMFMMKFQTT